MFIHFDRREQMSPFLADMSDVVGVEGVNQLVDARGGVHLYVSSSISKPGVLEARIGLEKANLLRKACGPKSLYVPKPSSLIWRVESIIGTDAATSLRNALGGKNVWVSNPNPKQTVVELILGRDESKALSKIYSGELLQIPRGATRTTQVKHVCIRNAFAKGLTVRQIARDFLLSERNVWFILRSPLPHQPVLDVPEYISPRGRYIAQINKLEEGFMSNMLRHMCSIIGIESVRTLIIEGGGTRVQCHSPPQPNSLIVRFIGMKKAKELCRHYSELLYIPNCIDAIAEKRNIAIKRDYDNGYKQTQLAKKYGLTYRYISSLLKKGRRIEEYGFAESQDFVCYSDLSSKQEGRGGHNRKECHITLDMAKELSMVERNTKGN